MTVRLTMLIFLLSCLGIMTGCSTAYRVSVEEARQMPKLQRFGKVVYPSVVYSVLLTPAAAESLLVVSETIDMVDSVQAPDRKIVFAPNTAYIRFDDRKVNGVDTIGDSVSFGFDQLTYIGFKNVGLAPGYMSPREVVAAVERGKTNPTNKVKHGNVPYWDVVSFEDNAGRIDENNGVVVGDTKYDTPVRVEIADVRYLEYKKFNLYKTMRFGLSIATLALFVKGFLDVTGGN